MKLKGGERQPYSKRDVILVIKEAFNLDPIGNDPRAIFLESNFEKIKKNHLLLPSLIAKLA